MGLLHRFFIVMTALVACGHSESSQGDYQNPKKQTEQVKSLIETVEGLSIEDFEKDGKLIVRILRSSGKYNSFLVDGSGEVAECTSKFCSSLRSTSEAEFSGSLASGEKSDVLTLVAKSGKNLGESLRIHLFTLDHNSFTQKLTILGMANKDVYVTELGKHFTNEAALPNWSMDFAYIEGTKLGAAILEDKREWTDMNTKYLSSSLLIIGSNEKVWSHVSLGWTFKEPDSGHGFSVGDRPGAVFFTLGNAANKLEEVRVQSTSKNLESSITIVYQMK